MEYDIMRLFRKDNGEGELYPELDLTQFCPHPDTWSKVNGENRKYKKYNLSSFLSRNGYELACIIVSVGPSDIFQHLTGLCIDSKGEYWRVRIPAARGFSPRRNKETWLKDMYLCTWKGSTKYCPDGAGIWFYNSGKGAVTVQWYELLLNISSEKTAPVYQSCVPQGDVNSWLLDNSDDFYSGKSEDDSYEGYDNWGYEDVFENEYYGMVLVTDEYGEEDWEYLGGGGFELY